MSGTTVLYRRRLQRHSCAVQPGIGVGWVWRCDECGRYWRWHNGERRLRWFPRLRIRLWQWRDAVKFRWEP